MTQAARQNTASAPQVDMPSSYRAFEIECDISDLVQMAKIAALTLHGVIGETEFDGCQVTRHDLTREGVARAMFSVSHLCTLIESLAEKYPAAAKTSH